jgi:hypothetical protein
MPKGLDGSKCPEDSVGLSVHISRIATGENEDTKLPAKRASGMAVAKARQVETTETERREVAERSATKRWA